VTDSAQREFAATEKRRWVRTIRACNNRCQFCLDTQMLDGFVVPPDEVKREIRAGADEGCQRLILSGGEASIHPHFLELVAYGRACGYTWIQTISNGRRFCYPKFTAQAAAHGLNEVTFSIHGHTPELADELSGIQGSFHQALQGLVNARKARLVVNVDVVLNRKNLPYLKEILDFFMDLGVHEFDLLWLVPFGRGFEQHREALFLPPGEAFPHIQRALEGRCRPGLYLWTNRFPVEYLEGYEWLIQEPYKLHDEVNGRREMFAEFARHGDGALGCLGERCDYCFMSRFCPTISRYRGRLMAPAERGFRRAVLGLDDGSEAAGLARFGDVLRQHPVERLEVEASDVAAAAGRVAALGLPPGALPPIVLRVERTEGLAAAAAARDTPLGAALRRVVWWRPEQQADVAAALAARPDLTVEWEANAALVELVPALAAPTPPVPPARTIVTVRRHDRLTKVQAAEVSPTVVRDALARLPPGTVRVRDLPPCLSGGQPEDALPPPDPAPDGPDAWRRSGGRHPEDALFPALLDAEGGVVPQAFTDRFIGQHYQAKSLRCRACAHDATCSGLHINALRAWGFRVLQPTSAAAPLSGAGAPTGA
jgi:MoaA/NifB/PqqE/SkfB family radical SAM enzyme